MLGTTVNKCLKRRNTVSWGFTAFFFYDSKIVDEKKIKTSLKQERFDFFGQDRTNASDVGTYHHLVIDILKMMIEPCPICIQSRFEKAFNCEPVNQVTSDCSHVFCTKCLKNEKIVSIIIFCLLNSFRYS
jgi:hypothetical protein